MELSQFVQSAISEIIRGINEAKKELARAGVGAAVNPVWDSADNLNDQHVLQMEFDVAVTVATTSKSDLTGSAKIRVVSADVGEAGQLTAEHSSVSRVKFSVPYIPPATPVIRPRRSVSSSVNYDPLDH